LSAVTGRRPATGKRTVIIDSLDAIDDIGDRDDADI
jgi:hypothetical protein